MSETCQKLAFTHPIAVLKSGLKNNCMKKLDRVNRPLDFKSKKKFKGSAGFFTQNEHPLCESCFKTRGGGYFGQFYTGTCRLGAQTLPCLKFFGTQKYCPV